MAEINAKDLTAKTSPASTDSMLLFGTTSNEGAKITVDNLADNILSRLTTKTFANQVGGSSAATILAQLATLNSKIKYSGEATLATPPTCTFTIPRHVGFLIVGYNAIWYGYATHMDNANSPDTKAIAKIAGSNSTYTISRGETALNEITITGVPYQRFAVVTSPLI